MEVTRIVPSMSAWRHEGGVDAVVAALLFVLAMAPLNAQATQRGAIDGVVSDTSLLPLGGAVARILGTELEVRTGENGRFRMLGLLPGQYLVAVHRLGYAPVSTFIGVAASDTAHASFLLRPIPTELDAVRIRAASVAPSLAEFEERRARGVGQFMTEADIRRLNFATTSGLFQTFMSTAVTSTSILNTRGFATRPCPYRIYIDGAAIAVIRLEDVLPAPSEIAGIEVYANSATVPPQYATSGGTGGLRGPEPGGAVCGVVLIWTKH